MVHYYRRLKWLILGLALLTGLVTIPVSAGNPEVNITVSAWSIMNPQGFTVTYVNDHQTDLSWTIPAGTTNVMIRSSAGRVPTDRTNEALYIMEVTQVVVIQESDSMALQEPFITVLGVRTQVASGHRYIQKDK